MLSKKGEAPRALDARALVVASLLFATLCVNFSWVQSRQDSDSVLMAFISIDRYLPFYWGDNRYGMLVPLLATFIQDYRSNLFFQSQILILSAVALVLVMNVWFLRRERGWTVRNVGVSAGALAIAAALFRPSERGVQAHLLAHPYHISLALALVAIALMLRMEGKPKWRWTGAVALLALSLWINTTNAPLLIGLFLLLPDANRSWTQTRRDRIAGVIATVELFVFVRLEAANYPSQGGMSLAPLTDITSNISKLAANTWDDILDPTRAMVFAVVLLIAAAIQWRRRFLSHLFAWTDGGVFAVLVIALGLAVASTDWVMKNNYEPRYWTLPLGVLAIIAASFLAERLFDLLERAVSSRQTAAAILGLMLIPLSVWSFGFPSPDRGARALAEKTAFHLGKVEKLQCTHMLGNYSTAWTTAFHARANGLANPRQAVTARAEPIEDQWSAMPLEQRKYCGLCGDPFNNFYEIYFKLGTLRHTGTEENMCRFEH